MTNLTISVDDDVLRRARIKALEQGTSVNAILRDYLSTWSGGVMERRQAVEKLLAVSAHAKSGRAGRRWTRDELHER